ncbi:C-terminal helicase domain-containing protein [Pseudoalteromonas sp. S16_S37]|uniref:C-terminal helicase domain-containing protein n=1 Tax=Pseudoalteromonas sp. S16_S37 TaxID=2720228 RepID=UPI00193351FD|nr:helicase-related protein [Pseudoalteromonas sp. S16_S37]
MNIHEAQEKFVTWLGQRMTKVGRGDLDQSITVKPSGKYWLGRIQSEKAVRESEWGTKGERLEPCAFGIKLKPKHLDLETWNIEVSTGFHVWMKSKRGADWVKSQKISITENISIPVQVGKKRHLEEKFTSEIAKVIGIEGLSAALEIEVEKDQYSEYELFVTLVNTSPKDKECAKIPDTRFYQFDMSIKGLATKSFIQSALEDSFRYDRKVPAYGINCGVIVADDGSFHTEDAITVDKHRPKYWNMNEVPPSLEFASLADEPLQSSRQLLSYLYQWGESNWSKTALETRRKIEEWSPEAFASAKEAAKEFAVECTRIETGISLLEHNENLLMAFKCMNEAMGLSSNGKYSSWRSFQFGFLLANLSSIVDQEVEPEVADVVWFATGGGKTETYLGLLITAAIYDRLTGKSSGITAWSRFPLRMLSLQQTQRFANAIAAADIVRKKHKIGGARFSLGFFVGNGATPNSIPVDPQPGDPDRYDANMPNQYKVLDHCPYCHEQSITMDFDNASWRLIHKCESSSCLTQGEPLPVYVVDEEIYRFLPTVVVGTLDKAASISMQAAMRGLLGAPKGKCSKGHGYTYAPRSKKPNGCLVPGCKGEIIDLGMDEHRFGPSFRLQDELHLLRDSLGAVDAHYEAIFDSLEQDLCGRKPKILASSATLTGYEKQVDVLYRRKGRVFPVPPPKEGAGFWTADSAEKMRKFIAVAPKGVTIEYTVDRLLAELQNAIRSLQDNPSDMCSEIGVPLEFADELISLYGTNVVYGNTIRDLEAVTRSAETQLSEVKGNVNIESLTGKTDFKDVGKILNRLDNPESNFNDRLHIIAASSMMSHGVDIDRLNVMVMLGIPLSAAEFIQATARVGRRYPSLVFVVHKIGRERDAGIYRSFKQFVSQGDRFVDPIPISKRSRQVLNRTISGLLLARLLMIHEYNGGNALTTVGALKDYYQKGNFDSEIESLKLISALDLEGDLDHYIRADIKEWLEGFEANIKEPPNDAIFPSDLSPTERQPMRSLRDVEKQVPIRKSTLNASRRRR